LEVIIKDENRKNIENTTVVVPFFHTTVALATIATRGTLVI
jgi:hypothetical protein